MIPNEIVNQTNSLVLSSEDLIFYLIKYQFHPCIETRQLICKANQLNGFYMRAKLAFNGLIT